MARTKVLSLRCPTCRKLVLREEPNFPFCSERCKMIDLGDWAAERYRVPESDKKPDDAPPDVPEGN